MHEPPFERAEQRRPVVHRRLPRPCPIPDPPDRPVVLDPVPGIGGIGQELIVGHDEEGRPVSRCPFFVGLAFVAVVVTTAIAGRALLLDPEHVRPPHAARSTASAPGPLPLNVVGGDQPQGVIDAYTAWIEGIARAEWFAGVERERQAQAERDAAPRAPASRAQPHSGPSSCDGIDWVIPVGIIVGESGCNFDAQSPAGFCSGYGCVGAYQFDARHWDADSGWGGCADLGDWTVPENQHECARRLSSDGTHLAPWGG